MTCPAPVRLTDEGRDWLVTGTAVAEDGREAIVSTRVNIDRTAPAVTITAPAPHATIARAFTSIAAAASDGSSGLQRATCNGQPASINGNEVSCGVAMRPGINDIIVQVMDAAGNSGSTGFQVAMTAAPTAAYIVPGVGTLAQGEMRPLSLVDDLGREFTDAQWDVSNRFVAMVQRADGDVLLRGLGPGTVTVTAVRGALRAEASFKVLPGRTLPLGTTRWSVSPIPGTVIEDTIYTHPTQDGPELFTIARHPADGHVVMAALTTAPRVLWIESPALRLDETIVDVMGEEYGGVLLKVDGNEPPTSAIVRVGRPGEGPLWRYESTGRITKGFAQGWDATVFFVEVPPDGFPQFVGLDGATGSVKFRWAIPRSTMAQQRSDCSARESRDIPAQVSGVTVPNGNLAAFTFVTEDEVRHNPGCSEPARWSRTLHLARVTADGEPRVQVLKTFAEQDRGEAITLRLVIPHYDDAVLAPWTQSPLSGTAANLVTRVTAGRFTAYALPFMGELGIGDDTAYTVTDDGRTLVVFNPASGQVRYIRHVKTGKISVTMVTADGGLVLHHAGPLLDEQMRPVPAPLSR